jgi:hypothetical protein
MEERGDHKKEEVADTAEAEKMEKGEDSVRNHSRGRRRYCTVTIYCTVGGVRRRQCSAVTEKIEKGGENIEEEEDSAGTMKVE